VPRLLRQHPGGTQCLRQGLLRNLVAGDQVFDPALQSSQWRRSAVSCPLSRPEKALSAASNT
jgi:hypothetical protein